jgi:NAD(P)-dependent dehydrogenase (short-subunit alcohol dehydrogenase family)
MSEAEWDAVFDTNVKGMFLVSRAVARQMIAGGVAGRIVNISSGAANSGRVGAAHYCASKAAVNMFTRVLAIELAPHGIVVNAVAPGLIEVPGWSLSEAYIDALVSATPLGRIGQPEDVARAVLYLASPAATFITGTVLGVDGGSQAGRAVPLSG